LERLAELEGGDLSELRKRAPDQKLRRFVVEHEHPLRVDQEHRRREVGAQFPSEDQGKALRRTG
jgi:hypothetical protein